MLQFYTMLYFIILGITIYYKNILLVTVWSLIGLILVIVFPIVIKVKKENIREKIKGNKNIKDIEPFINVNTEPWYIIEELPGFTRVSAKKAVWLRKKNRGYSSKKLFYELNNISDEDKKILNKIIYI